MAGTSVSIDESALQSDPGMLDQLDSFAALTGIRVVLIDDHAGVPGPRRQARSTAST